MKNFPVTVAEALLDSEAVIISLDPPFTWTSGLKSPIYCDLRALNADVEGRRNIVEAFVTMFPLIKDADVIAGTATAGISWGAWIAEKLDKPFVYIRSKAKEHGTKKRIEGRLFPKQKVTIIEDLISTGGSSISSAEAIREEGKCEVTDIYAINTYMMKKAEDNFTAAGLHAHSITDYEVILSVLKNRGMITQEQETILADFSADPGAWAGKHGLD